MGGGLSLNFALQYKGRNILASYIPIDGQVYCVDNTAMIRAFTLAIASLSDRRIFAVLVKSVMATGAIFLLLGLGLWFAIDSLADSWLGDAKGWIATTVAIASVITTILSAWLLFRIVAITVIWFFADDIVEAVEQKHYPVAGLMGKRPNVGQSAGLATRSILLAIMRLPCRYIFFCLSPALARRSSFCSSMPCCSGAIWKICSLSAMALHKTTWANLIGCCSASGEPPG